MRVLHAGSLTTLVQQHLELALFQASGIRLESESGHSVALATAIKAGLLSGEFSSALMPRRMRPYLAQNGAWITWFVIFACNAAVLAYSPKSPFPADFELARRGAIPGIRCCFSQESSSTEMTLTLHPMGYYTVLVCALAEEHYRIPDLKQWALGSHTNPAQINEGNFARLERGEIDALFLYQSGALERGLPYLALPDEINLSNPRLATTYARVHFTTNAGQTFRGKPISFSAAVLRKSTEPRSITAS